MSWALVARFFSNRANPRKAKAGAGATLGSFGTRAGFGYFSVGDERAGVLAGISAERATNDYRFNDDRGTLFQSSDDAERVRTNADSHLRDVWLLARARPSSRARFELTLNDVAREQGVPKLALVPSRRGAPSLRTLAALTTRLSLGESQRAVLTLRTSVLDDDLDDSRSRARALRHFDARNRAARAARRTARGAHVAFDRAIGAGGCCQRCRRDAGSQRWRRPVSRRPRPARCAV